MYHGTHERAYHGTLAGVYRGSHLTNLRLLFVSGDRRREKAFWVVALGGFSQQVKDDQQFLVQLISCICQVIVVFLCSKYTVT